MTAECLSILNNYNQPFYGCPMLLHSIFGPTTITTTNQRMRTPRETDFPIVRVPASALGLTLCSPVYPLLLMFWAFRTINILPNNTDILFGGAIYLAKWSPTLRVLSILPNQTVRNWWNYREKMQRHRSIETKFESNQGDPFAFWPEFWLLLGSRAGNENFGKGTASFGQTRKTRQRRPPLEIPNGSIYFATEISDNFGIMESNLSWGNCQLHSVLLNQLSVVLNSSS